MKGRCMLAYEIETTLQAQNLQIKAYKKERFCQYKILSQLAVFPEVKQPRFAEV